MNTLLLNASSDNDVLLAANLLKAGHLVAIPTETVYGLAANAHDDKAVESIFTAKGRPANHPLIVHIGRLEQLHKLACDIPAVAFTLARAFWPGPLTLLLNKAPQMNNVVTGGLDTIGVRMPDHPVSLPMLNNYDLMVAAPSANLYKKLSPTGAEQVFNSLRGKISAVLDGGPCEVGLESTIVDLTLFNATGEIFIRRSGHVTAKQISEAIGIQVNAWKPHNVPVPGNVSAHYQPCSRLLLKRTEQILAALDTASDLSIGFACHTRRLKEKLNSLTHPSIPLPADKQGFARNLYAALYQLDKTGVEQIWLELPPQSDDWTDVNDRLMRAAHR